jgi:hypothetical protein
MAGANEMTTWTPDQLERIGTAEELQLAYPRTLSAFAAIDEVAPASAKGTT